MNLSRIGKLINTIALPGTPDTEVAAAARMLRLLFSTAPEAPSALLDELQASRAAARRPGRWRKHAEELTARLSTTEAERDSYKQQRDELASRLTTVEQAIERVQPGIVADLNGDYRFADFMWETIRRFGQIRRWMHAYCAASVATEGATAVALADIMAWQNTKTVPGWAFRQLSILRFRAAADDTYWTIRRLRFLAALHGHDPTAADSKLAAACAREFGRPVHPSTIREALQRVRRRGLTVAPATRQNGTRVRAIPHPLSNRTTS